MMSRIAAVLVCSALYALTARANVDKAPRVVKGWGALMQVVTAVERYVATGELSSVHNEDVMLASAISVLQTETRLASPAKQQELTGVLATFGRQIGDLHQAADAFDGPEAKIRLQKVLATYAQLKRFYGDDVLAPARRLASVWACPMHREVVGKSTDTCPKCAMALDQPVRIPLFSMGGVRAQHTVRASIRTPGPLEVGKEVKATLRLRQLTNAPLLITDLRVVHTERIHLLIVDARLA